MAELLTGDDLDRAVEIIRAGRLVAFPTETVYGLGANVGSATAVARIFAAKGRPTGHPLIAHVGSRGGLERLGRNVGPTALALAEAFWPGPLTIIVERCDQVVPEVTGGRATLGVRMPDHSLTLRLLETFGGGLAGPSANRFGAVSPTTASHVLDDLGEEIDAVLDGGPCRVGLESTIVDTTGDRPVLLRPGAVSAAELEAVVGQPVQDGRGGPSRASGMLASHYAPRATVRLVMSEELATAVETERGRRVGVIAPRATLANRSMTADSAVEPSADETVGEPMVSVPPCWGLPDQADAYGQALYATLRAADQEGLDLLLVVPPADGALLEAVLDRLTKAAGPR